MLFVQIFITVFISLGAYNIIINTFNKLILTEETNCDNLIDIMVKRQTRTLNYIIQIIILLANLSFRILILAVIWHWWIF